MTHLEAQFLEALKKEAYGGTLFTEDIIAKMGVDARVARGVVSSLVKKNLIEVEDFYGTIGIIVDGEADYEITKAMVEKLGD